MSDILLILLGSLLGVLSPGLIDAIGRRRRAAELLKVLAAELSQVRFLACMVLVQLSGRMGKMDQGTLDLVRSPLLDYTGDSDDLAFLESTRKILEQGDTVYIKLHNQLGSQKKPMRPTPYATPFLDSQIGNLGLLSVQEQRGVLRIVTELGLFNEQVAYVRLLMDRTFDSSLSKENYAINDQNLAAANEKQLVRARELILAINRVFNSSGQPRR